MVGRVCRSRKLLVYLLILVAVLLIFLRVQKKQPFLKFIDLNSRSHYRSSNVLSDAFPNSPSPEEKTISFSRSVPIKGDNGTKEEALNMSEKMVRKSSIRHVGDVRSPNTIKAEEAKRQTPASNTRPRATVTAAKDTAATFKLRSVKTPPLHLVYEEKESIFSRVTWPEGINFTSTVPKIIDWYNPPSWWRRLGQKTVFSSCPIQSCRINYDGKLLKQADAVIIHGRDIVSTEPPPRRPGQVWVWFTIEAPANHKRKQYRSPKWVGSFNWTMMYRRDSDIWLPYGFLRRLANPKPRNFSRIFRRKSRSVSWIVSNMHAESRRHDYVALLKSFVPVDMYGRCRGLCTPWKGGNPEWNEFVTENYRFYLSFENNHCRDYVTEKMLKTYNSEVVPVVRGGPWMEYAKFFPKETFLDTQDFKTVRDLAQHLKHLEQSEAEYVEILKKRSHYVQGNTVDFIASAMCQLCVRLHNVDKFQKTYPDIHKWLTDGVCDNDVKDLIKE